MKYHETADVLNDSVYEYDNYDSNRPNCVEPDGYDGYPEPDNVVTDGMTYQEKIDILRGSVYDSIYFT